LLEAFRIAHLKSRAELVLVGHGPDELLLRQMTRDLGLNEAVVFTGPKTQDEVSQTLMGSDCLVLPSLSEPWGLVSIEALCTGIPVVVSNRCGCARNVVTEETGWTFPAEDTEELARTLAEVCSLPLERLQKMGEAAVKLSAEYSPDACAKRILANLEELLARHRGALGGINGDA
jgi:1,2-diacylglycerol 3-alpha-glucosyltransferase